MALAANNSSEPLPALDYQARSEMGWRRRTLHPHAIAKSVTIYIRAIQELLVGATSWSTVQNIGVKVALILSAYLAGSQGLG